MTEGQRGRGRPRQGPFSGEKTTFTTKITKQTLDRLARSAKQSRMSISQKGEAAIIRGLDAEDDFERYLSAPLEEFKRQAIGAMPDRSQSGDADSCRVAFKMLIGKLADDLLWSVEALTSSVISAPLEKVPNEALLVTPSSVAPKAGQGEPVPSSKRTGRKIDIE